MADSKLLSNDSTGEKHELAYDERCLTEEENEVRIVLVGRTGSGISSSGNSILRRNAFLSIPSGSSITKNCCIETTTRDGKMIKVVDTPGFFGNSMSIEEIRHEVLNCFFLTKPGPHAILYILRIGRFTNEEIQCVKRFLEIFGGNPLKHTVIVFTGLDDLRWNKSSTKEFLNNAPITLTKLINECSGRFVFFNNRSNSMDADTQLDDLFIIVEHMLKENTVSKDSYYTNHVFTQIGEDMRLWVENKTDQATGVRPYMTEGGTVHPYVAVGGTTLATGMVCAVTGGPFWLPFVAGIFTFGYCHRYNKSDDKLSKVIEEIKEDSSIQCTIS